MNGHADTAGRRRMRWWIALTIVLLTVSGVAWFHFGEHFARYYAYIVLPLLGLVLLGLWYAFFTSLPWREKLAAFGVQVLILALAVGAFAGLFRREGTWGGTSLVKFVPRWAPKETGPVELEEAAPEQPERPVDEVPGLLRDSPQFLGPARTGEYPDIHLDPDWAAHPPELVWKKEIGEGWASFSVHGRNAITMEQRGDREMTTCHDLLTGGLIWAHADEGLRFEESMGGVGPRSTPLIAGGRVYTQGPSGNVNCLDEATGERLWTFNPQKEMEWKNPQWGKSNSPLLHEGRLIITGGRNHASPLLLALDPETGERLWESGPGAAGYSSPTVIELMGGEQIVCANQYSATGHDPGTGRRLWEFPWEGEFPKVAQPRLVGPDRLLLTASYSQGSFLISLESGQPEVIWKSSRMKTKFSTTAVRGGYAWGLDEGVFACIDLATGERLWKGGRYGFGQQILVGDHLLVQTEQGDLVLLEANPERHVELARVRALEGVTWTVPTLAGSWLLVRNAREAACYRLKLAE